MSDDNDNGDNKNNGSLSKGFGEWIPLTHDGIARCPDAPAAVQVSTEDRRLVQYPKGKSAMVFYFYAARSAREALRRAFAEELDERGARGEGPLAFRTLEGGDDVKAHLERLFTEFEERFGDAPVLHVSE